MQAKTATKQKKKAIQLDSDGDDMSMDDDSEDSDFEEAPKKARLCTLHDHLHKCYLQGPL